MYDTEADKTFCKKYGRKGQWLGCEVTDCQYWAHAICAGLTITRNTDVNEIPFRWHFIKTY